MAKSQKLSKTELAGLVKVNFPGLEYKGVPVRNREKDAHGHAMKAVPVARKRKGRESQHGSR